MTVEAETAVLVLFAAYCRIGACFMMMPGLGTVRVPMMVRVFASIAVALAILPLMWNAIAPRVALGTSAYITIIGGELLIGATFGLIARFYVLALQFAGTSISMVIGFNMPGTPDMFEQSTQTALASILSLAGLLVLFALDFHHVVFSALTESYAFLPLGTVFDPRTALVALTDTLSESFFIVLQLASPFLIYGLVFNLAVGLVNKLSPQIPIYFISMPFMIFGGLILLMFAVADFLHIFADRFAPVFLGRF